MGAFEHIERALHRIGRGNLARRRVHNFNQGSRTSRRVHGLREQFGRHIQVHAAGAARQCRADGARNAHADVLRVQDTERRFAQRLGNRQLVHFFVIALLEVNDLALAGAADQNHREAIGRGIGQGSQAVQKARRGDGQADARLLGQKPGGSGGITSVLFVAEGDHPHPCGLRHTRQVGNRDSRQTKDGVDAVELERVNDQMDAVGLRGLRQNRLGFARGRCCHGCSSVR